MSNGFDRRHSAAFAAALLAGLVAAGTDARAETPGKSAGFAMPATSDQWRPDVFGKNGAYRFRQTEGNCQVTFVQNRGADAARAAGRQPRDSIDGYIDAVAAKVGRLERTDVDALEIASSAGERVPFVSMEFAYVGKDTIEYHNRISGAWLDDVELVVIAACPVSEWLAGRPSIDALIDEVSITRF